MYKKEVVFKDSIGQFIWYPEIKALLHTYFETSFDANDEEFFEHVIALGETMKKYNPIGLIQDYTTLRFVVSPTLQVKIVEYIKPVMLESGVKRYAKLVPDDVISKLMAEQIVQEARKVSSQVIPDKLFYELEPALEWINKANQ